jgi:hypothetical protein
MLTIILAFGVATGLSTGLSSSPMKVANCTSKVLELAQKGIVSRRVLWSNIRMYSYAWSEFSIWRSI